MLAEARFTGPEVTGALEVDGHGATARVARPTMWGAASLAVKQGWNKNRSQLSTWNPACSIASAVWRVRWQTPASTGRSAADSLRYSGAARTTPCGRAPQGCWLCTEATHDPVQLTGNVLSCHVRVGGLSDDHAGLVEQRNQELREGGRVVGVDQTLACALFERGPEQRQGVAVFGVAAPFPSEHGWSFNDDASSVVAAADLEEAGGRGLQRVPHIAVAGDSRRSGLDEVGFDVVEHRDEQLLLVAEVVIQRALGDPGACAHFVEGGRGVALSADEPSGGMDEGAAGVGRVIRPSAIDHT